MPINRFDTSVQPDYVSNRIALPFNEIHAMAAQHQKDYDTTEENAYKLKDLMANVKSINDPTLGLSNIQAKQQLDKTYSPEIEALSSDIAKGTNIHEASRKLEQLKRKWISDPNRIELEKSYADYANYVEDKTKKGGKYSEYNDPYKNTALISDKGELKPFRYSGMADIEDYQGRAKDMMAGHMADTLGYKNAQLGPDGIIRTNFGKGEVIDANKIKQSAFAKAPDFLTTKEGKDWERMTKHQYPNVTQEQLQAAAGDYLFNAGMNQIHRGKETGNAIDVTAAYEGANKQKQFEEALIGSPREGLTVDLTKDNKDFQELKKNNYIKTNNDGTINVDWVNLKTNKPVYHDSQGNLTTSAVDSEGNQNTVSRLTSNEKLNKVVKVVKDIANKIGYKGEFKAENYNDIIKKYNAYSKVRLADEQMTAPVSEIESEKAIRNWNNYDVVDPTTGGLPLSDDKKPTINKDDKLVLNNWENSADGKMVRSGYILKYDNEGNSIQVPIKVRPKTIIDDGYHDKISKLGLKAAKYEVEDTKPIRTEGDGINAPLIKVIDEVNFPGVAHVEVFDTGDKKSRFHVTPNDGSGARNFGTQAEMQQYLLSKFYTGTRVGKADTYYVAPAAETFKSTKNK